MRVRDESVTLKAEVGAAAKFEIQRQTGCLECLCRYGAGN
jgi:hypothetical protein